MKKPWLLVAIVCAGVALCSISALLYVLPLDVRERSPVQPLAFSHALHAGTNAIPCAYCHRYTASAKVAGIPAVADCRDCHRYIAAKTPEIQRLTKYWDTQTSISWIRVYSLPDHVYFPHMMHIHAGIECSHCHGTVAAMERITRSVSLKMGWCLECHRQHKASIDCWTCHI